MLDSNYSARLPDLVGQLRASKTIALLTQSGFRRLYFGRMASRVGDTLYFIAVMWLVYQLTGSTFYTGVAGFLSRIPQLFSVLFGPLIDRARLGRLLVLVEAAQGIVVLVVPVAAWLQRLNVFVVLTVVTVLALFRRVTAPAEQAALPRLVDESHLARANSIDAATKQTLGTVAEAASGVLISTVGAIMLLLFNSVTFAVSTLFFGLLSIPATDATGTILSMQGYADDLREGVDVITHSVLSHMLIAVVLASIFTGMAMPVLPVFAATFEGAESYGLLIAATTVGTLIGSVIASRFETVRLSAVTISGFVCATASRIGSIMVEQPLVVFALYGAAAIPVGVYNVLTSTAIQIGVPDELLARVSSTTETLLALLAPFGMLVGGYVGTFLGSATVIGLSALGYSGVAGYWALIPALRGFPAIETLEQNSFGQRS